MGINVLDQPIEVKPITHYTLGGVRINEWAETSVPGLYAAGEIEGNIHGANRTSGNALAETQVFGRRSGIRAAKYARGIKPPTVNRNEITAEFDRINSFRIEQPNGLRPIDVKRRIKAIMHRYVHYRRSATGLTKAITELQRLQSEEVPLVQAFLGPATYNYEWEEAIEVGFMARLAEMVAASALAREESRGHHWRTDFPEMRPEWEKHTIARLAGPAQYQIVDAPVIRLKDRNVERRQADPALVKAKVLEGYQVS